MDQTAHALEQCVASEYFNKEIVLSYYSKYLKSNLFWDHNKFTYGSIKAIASNRFTCEEFLGCWRSLMCCDVITDTWRNQFFSTHTLAKLCSACITVYFAVVKLFLSYDSATPAPSRVFWGELCSTEIRICRKTHGTHKGHFCIVFIASFLMLQAE